MRAFVAIDLPFEEKDRLFAAAAPLRALDLPVRWVAPASLHLTLKFLGNVGERDAEAVRRALRVVAAAHDPLQLEVRGIGAFPSALRPRVWWVGVVDTPALRALQQAIEHDIAPLGFPTEAREYHPHVTLGRAESGSRQVDPSRLAPVLDDFSYHARLSIGSIHLMRSHLSRSGARYERVADIPLAAGAAVRSRG